MHKPTLTNVKRTAVAAAFAAGLSLSGIANAGFIATLDDSDCAGVFSNPTGFATCTIPAEYDPTRSPVIAKFDAGTGGWTFNTALFPNVTADDFTLTINADGTGTWVYTPDDNGVLADDPLVTFYVAKASNQFNLFGNGVPTPPFVAPQLYLQTGPYPNTNTWFTPENKELSHITFYDSAGGTVPPEETIPEPASLLLTAAGLLGLGLMRRRRRL